MNAVALALGAALLWGAGDYWLGLGARRAGTVTAVIWASLAGLLTGMLALALVRPEISAGTIGWSLLGGSATAVSFSVFLAAMAAGPMSLVAPLVAAIGAVIPVVASVIAGSVPSPLHLAAMAVTLLGGVLIALPPRDRGSEGVGHITLRAFVLTVVAALAGGVLWLVIQLASSHSDPLVLSVGVRAVGTGLTVVVAVIALDYRPTAPKHSRLTLGLGGALAMAAMILFTAASTEQSERAIVAVLASLYPAITITMARRLLRESLAAAQAAGVMCVLLGVGALAV